jgi:hypothetical protein
MFCKECDAFLIFDQFDEGELPRDLVIGPDEKVCCKTCGKTRNYSSYDVRCSSSPNGANLRARDAKPVSEPVRL